MIQIEEMVLRLPGIGAEESRSLANEVGQLIAEALPANTENLQIPELKIRMTNAQLNDSGSTAAAIAKQVVMQIKLATLR